MLRLGFWGLQVQLRSKRSRVLIALGAAIALSGCANVDFDSEQAWFAKPLDFFGRKGGYTFSELQETKQHQRPIAASDLVNGNGACAPRPAPQAPPPGGQAAAPATPAGDNAALLGGGVAFGMSECDVVARAGQPNSVQIGKNPNGDRTAVLTYNGGPRPGIYHFERGALTAMDRVAAPAPTPAPEVAKKKSAKPAKSAKSAKPQKKNET